MRTLVVLGRDGGADDEAAGLVGRRVGVALVLLHVLDGDEAGEPALAVDDGQLLDAVLVELVAGARGRRVGRSRRRGREVIASRTRASVVAAEAQVAGGDDAHELARSPSTTGRPVTLVLVHDGAHVAEGPVLLDGDRASR